MRVYQSLGVSGRRGRHVSSEPCADRLSIFTNQTPVYTLIFDQTWKLHLNFEQF